jgi:glutamate-1-semialdehyde aminotransferase
VWFSNSGSEVVGTAVRLARAHTGRPLIIRFEGHYHGWQDTVYWSNYVDPELAGPSNRRQVHHQVQVHVVALAVEVAQFAEVRARSRMMSYIRFRCRAVMMDATI